MGCGCPVRCSRGIPSGVPLSSYHVPTECTRFLQVSRTGKIYHYQIRIEDKYIIDSIQSTSNIILFFNGNLTLYSLDLKH